MSWSLWRICWHVWQCKPVLNIYMISKKTNFRKYTFIHFWRTIILIRMLFNMKKSEVKYEFFHNTIENPPKMAFKQGQNSLIKFFKWQLGTVKLWCTYTSSLVLTRTYVWSFILYYKSKVLVNTDKVIYALIFWTITTAANKE